MYFLDVGQGDAILFRLPTGENFLIDTGKDSAIFRSLDKVLPWYVKKIDYVLITHGDLDHIGALPDILRRYKVDIIFVSYLFGEKQIEQDIQKQIQHTNTKIIELSIGDYLTFGTSIKNNFKIIHPNSDCFEKHKSHNECSLVVLAQYGEHTFLLTGDIGKKVEPEVSKFIDNTIDVLKVAHHGSKYSTGEDFVSKTKPQYSVISVGQNSYGHPTKEVLDILSKFDSVIFSTKETATIVAVSSGENIKVKSLFDQTRFFQSSICAIFLYGFDASC